MKIYYCNLNEFNDLSGKEFLSPERYARVERYRTVPAKKACLVAGLLLRMILGDDYEDKLITNAHGKPKLKDNSLYFNLSHSSDYVVLAVADCELGIDIEKIAPYNSKVAERCFTEDEQKWMKQQEYNVIHQPFYFLWTGKEAVMKATGIGFAMKPESFSLLPIENGPHKIHEQIWHLYWSTLDNHQICVATANAAQMEWEFISREDLLGYFHKSFFY